MYQRLVWINRFKLALRIGLLIITTWTILLVVNTTIILLPVTIGRTIFAFSSQHPIIHTANFNGKIRLFHLTNLSLTENFLRTSSFNSINFPNNIFKVYTLKLLKL